MACFILIPDVKPKPSDKEKKETKESIGYGYKKYIENNKQLLEYLKNLKSGAEGASNMDGKSAK